ncbi:MAG: hypothetical protein FJY09_08100 [Chlorobi bacterium]|nr:hypothetical protein [Chlorobiota bacterium]
MLHYAVNSIVNLPVKTPRSEDRKPKGAKESGIPDGLQNLQNYLHMQRGCILTIDASKGTCCIMRNFKSRAAINLRKAGKGAKNHTILIPGFPEDSSIQSAFFRHGK